MKQLILLFILTITFVCKAQTLDDVAQTFGAYPGFGGIIVKSMAIQTDGKVVIGGSFDYYDGLPEKNISRLNEDGSKDTSFNTGSGFNSSVNSIALQTDGKILVGGSFTNYNSLSENRIIRLNADGSKDTSFVTGNGFNRGVQVIALQTDGKILVGGNLDVYQGYLANNIIRLNEDGSKDTSFNIGSGFSNSNNNYSSAYIYSITIQPDGKILVGGNFTEYNGSTVNRIVRLNEDGSEDTSFVTGSGFSGDYVESINLQTDGKILVGGDFTQYNGFTENNIIRLNVDGSKDATFNTGVGFNDTVNTISVQTDGKILVGGVFTEYSGLTESKIIRLNSNGSKDTSFTTGTGFYPNGNGYKIKSLVLQTDGKILVGGIFTVYNGSLRKHHIRLNTDGTRDTGFNTGNGFNGPVLSTFEQTDGKILVGGYFTEYKGLTENGIIRLNADGSKDTSFATGSGFNVNINPTSSNTFRVKFITVQEDSKILIGGSFTEYDGLTENKIIRLNADGSKDASFVTGSGFNGTIYSITLQTDGKILICGEFTKYKGLTENRIIRLNVDGSKDHNFVTGSGFYGYVTSIDLQTDGKILVGGYFTEYNGSTESHIIRLNADGSKDTSFNTGTGFDLTVHSIKIQADGKVLVGGYFTEYNGSTENRIIRLNADGSRDSSFDTGTGFNGTIYSITLQTDGKILAVGGYSEYNGILWLARMIRLNTNGSIDTSFSVGTGFSGSIVSVVEQSNGNILVGGGYLSYMDSADSSFLIALNATSTLSDDTFVSTESFSFWPNPTNNVIHLSIPEYNYIPGYNYKILNMNGKVLQQDKITKLETEISLDKLASGVYLIEMKSSNTKVIKRIIKQ